jgi:hypothetical protein
MISGAAKNIALASRSQRIQEIFKKEENFLQWMEHPASSILQHDEKCCEEARLWFLAYSRAMEINALSQFEIKAPTWLSQKFEWGPTEWPIFWCELVKEKVIDCGVFAALAREIFKAQGFEAHPAQALLSYNEVCTNHWKELWKRNEEKEKKEKKKGKGKTFPWIGDKVVYHEICLLEMPDGTAKVYDSTWGNWYLPQHRLGFGALLALRTECPRLLRWGNVTLSCGEWVDV